MDKLEPSPDFMDVAAFYTKPLPLQVVFWRRHLQGGRVTDKVLHRNPLLDEPLLVVAEVVVLGMLHTLYLGVILRFVSAVFWRAIEANPWGGRRGPGAPGAGRAEPQG
jgi:hypothetical protein